MRMDKDTAQENLWILVMESVGHKKKLGGNIRRYLKPNFDVVRFM